MQRQQLEHSLRRDEVLQQVEAGRPRLQLLDHGYVQGARFGQSDSQTLQDPALVQGRARTELRRQRKQVAASHGRSVPSRCLSEQLQVERVSMQSCQRASG
jgi:hypothetical protein